jgi:broad specificity phosphatase PhoE
MTLLLLVRHGETDWNREGRYQGQADPPLNETGRAQAESLARQLEGRSLEAIYSSDLQRAYDTARRIASRLGLPLQVDRRLREINQGEWEGMLVTDIMARYPTEWASRQQDRLHTRPPGGETLVELAQRLWVAVDEIALRYPVGPVLIVSHGLALATLLCRVDGIPLEQAHTLIPDNALVKQITWPAR